MGNNILAKACCFIVLWLIMVTKVFGCPGSPPEADFSGPLLVCIGEDAEYTDASTDPDESSIWKWEWTGGGSPGTGDQSSFTTSWSSSGIKVLSLKVWDNDDPELCGGQPLCFDKSDTEEKNVT